MLDKKVVNVKPNKSSTYILPFIDEQLNLKFNNLLLNSYISYGGEDEIFCILYNWKSDQEFLKFEGELMKHVLFLDHEDYGDKVLYKFKLPRNISIGRKKFLEGKHVDFSEDHKNSIERYLTKTKARNKTNIMEILDPNFSRVSSPVNMDSETFSKQVKTIKYKTEDFKYEGY